MSHADTKPNRAKRAADAIRRWINRMVLRRGHDQCHDAAVWICTIGQVWDTDTQYHLNQAKDHLYTAARRFDEGRAWKPSEDEAHLRVGGKTV